MICLSYHYIQCFITNSSYYSIQGKYLLRIIDECCKNLEYFDASGSFQLDNDCVEQIVSKCTKLKYLSVQNCRKLTDECIKSFTKKRKPALKVNALNIGGNYNITLTGFYDFLNHYPLSGALLSSLLLIIHRQIYLCKTKHATHYTFIHSYIIHSCIHTFMYSYIIHQYIQYM